MSFEIDPEFTQGSPFSVLGDVELDSLSKGHCPVCHYRGFVIGPRGGASLNVECGNVECRSRYNVTWISGQAVFAHDLFDGRTAPPWPSEPE